MNAIDMSKDISDACRLQHRLTGAVLPPQVCPFCMRCPLGTLFVRINYGVPQDGPRPIPGKEVSAVQRWLDELRVKA